MNNLPQFSISENIILGFWESLAIIFSSLLAGFFVRYIYTRYSQSISSKSSYGNTLLMVTVCVAGLIAVVKSSLALSLGLVGALSVIRFRTAVKEPYTLAFILFAVCIGISIGASQYIFAILILLTGSFIAFFSYFRSTEINSKFLKNNDIDTLTITAIKQENIMGALSEISEKVSIYNLKNITNNVNAETVATIGIVVDSNSILDDLLLSLNKMPGILSVSFYNSPN